MTKKIQLENGEKDDVAGSCGTCHTPIYSCWDFFRHPMASFCRTATSGVLFVSKIGRPWTDRVKLVESLRCKISEMEGFCGSWAQKPISPSPSSATLKSTSPPLLMLASWGKTSVVTKESSSVPFLSFSCFPMLLVKCWLITPKNRQLEFHTKLNNQIGHVPFEKCFKSAQQTDQTSEQ